MIEYVAFGVIVDDIVFPQGYTQMGVLGGGGPQTAWGMAAALGSGDRIGLVAGIGADLDNATLAPMFAAGVNLDGVRVTNLPTPRAWQTLEWNGRRTQVWRVPGETIGAQLAHRWDVLPPHYQDARAFHWGIHPSEAEGGIAFANLLRTNGKRLVSLEPFRPPARALSDDELRALLACCDIFSPNLLEALVLTRTNSYSEAIARFKALGAQILAVRRGPEGADVWNLAEGAGVHVPAVETNVVDVVGAGNAFCGALLTKLPDGIAEAACHASAAASYLIEQVGLPPALPDPADYERRLDEARAGQIVLKA